MHDASISVCCRGVTKSFGSGETRTQALRGVDLDVRAGELFMLVGPSGCGKTTLISVMAGILDQDEGACALLGQDMSLLSPRERTVFRGRNIGFVFQAFNLVPTLTAVENACLPLLINGVPRTKALDVAAARLEEVGLSGRENSLPRDLSGGQQQRVAIARALVHEPRLVVCDEPTSALDHTTGKVVMDLLRSLATTGGRSLVIVTHDSRIFEYADHMAHMDDGRIDRVETA
ncbi:ABC transporter ATP-binding protein [Fundidesulfovibrio terrae]|uniref:ABC transporter ATP-binding protein n=1 Tax=Fundidesulfovibrio terrae TaxID=2922866 RepID=UPI001FB02CBB|nr:ABC transporter ATP-binding protein [Fundidesulfovibrio terrae]